MKKKINPDAARRFYEKATHLHSTEEKPAERFFTSHEVTKPKPEAVEEVKRQTRTEDIRHLKVYTLTEIESILGVTHRTLLTYVKNGKLPARKPGGKWVVTEEDLQAFLERQK